MSYQLVPPDSIHITPCWVLAGCCAAAACDSQFPREFHHPDPTDPMEEDEQAQPEGDSKEKVPGEPEPEPEAPRCGRHPSQLRPGVCSSCLMERLSSVRGDQPESEIVEVAAAAAEAECSGAADADRGRLRNTLMLLFQLDDSTSGGARPSEGPQSSAAEEFQSGSGGDRDGGGKRKGPGSWLRSIRALRWRRNGASAASAKDPAPSLPPRRVAVVGPSASNGDGGGGAQVERKPSFRRSCEWMAYPSRGAASSLEPPRHSWDGSMVGRALACSFACLEEREAPEEDGDGARRARRSNAEEARAVAAESRSGGRSDLAEAGGDGRRLSFRGRSSCDAAGVEMAAVSGGVGRRRSNRWSRVWDRSITSPLKEFVRKGEHVLERSLSESRREVRRGKNAEAADISGEIHQPGRNGHVPGRASQGAIRSSQAASSGDVQNFRTDWLKNSKIGRSRSVHYTSPGNLDNGMLRFYLTPMRSSRTANRGRRRSSGLFARGLFGLL